MSNITIGIVDYGMGNHASVVHSLRDIDLRVRVSSNAEELDLTDILMLPGVGAFPAGMATLHERGLVSYLKEKALEGRPLIGICLGMQLLTSASHEHTYTAGLDLIPGEFIPFADNEVHIGWNVLDVTKTNSRLASSNGEAFYFNHSFHYKGAIEYQAAKTSHNLTFSSVIQHGNVVGLQFHPEKSQIAGKILLKELIMDLVHA